MDCKKKKGIFLAGPDTFRIDYIFAKGRRKQYEEVLDMCPDLIHEGNLEEHRDFLRQTEVIVCTWERPILTAEQIAEYLPDLKLLIYVAGSVQTFARPYLERGVRVVSAWGVMCKPVAEFAVGEIIHANKGFYRSLSLYRELGYDAAHWDILKKYPGTYHTKVGILGAGMIGSEVIRMLKACYDVELMVFDPFLPPARQSELGLDRLYSLEEIFSECQTISNHIANNPQTVGMLDYHLFSLMKDNATFINTGRGAQVVEDDLIRALTEKPERSAVLDVTWPEPVRRDLQAMPNVFCTPHIAGFAADEVLRMTDVMLDILKTYLQDGTLRFEVTLEMLKTMA
ncbi:MAG: hypothetical protein IJM90_06220 [Firmicutes bacterium]|nr:hypothetical protein [Bacillota bacterium]